jgi:hypothetical protein
MNSRTFIHVWGALLVAPIAGAINPTMPLKRLDEARGFPTVIACQDPKDDIIHYRIILNPAQFLSHFQHGFPDRKPQVSVTLRGANTDGFKGVTVELGTASSDEKELPIVFSVPTSDLDRYDLEFQCSIPFDNLPIIGGELYYASLAEFRRAPSTTREDHPIGKKPEAELNAESKSWMGPTGSSFGGPIRRIARPPSAAASPSP